MQVAYLADVHISKRAVEQLRKQGVDILHCEELGRAEDDDPSLLAHANELDRVFLTCDHGFRAWGFQRLEQGLNHSGILLLHQWQHCQDVGKVVKIVLTFDALVNSESDLQNQLYEGKTFE
jgi:hypothetical protein